MGRDRAGDADHGADGRHLPHPRGARGGVEIFHPRQRRHRPGAVRYHPGLYGGAAGGGRGPRRHDLDRADRARPGFRPGASESCIRVPDDRLRHQGRPRAAARVAAGRACRRPDADLGGAFGSAPECRALRTVALQASACGQSRRGRTRAAARYPRAFVADLRGVHAVPPARHQTLLRLFVGRAHGHHRLRLRHRRSDREFRRPACT